MRTFHTGGIAGEDITHGLPRVVELFEARKPKGAACWPGPRAWSRIDEDDTRPPASRSSPTTASEDAVLGPARAHLEVVDGPGGRPPATPSSRARWTPRSCSRSRASARPSSTWSRRCRRSTAPRACRSTTSTSSSSSARCSAGCSCRARATPPSCPGELVDSPRSTRRSTASWSRPASGRPRAGPS